MKYTKTIDGVLVDLGDLDRGAPGAVFQFDAPAPGRLEIHGLTVRDCREIVPVLGVRARVTITVEKLLS